MDIEYLEDYMEKEKGEIERVLRRIKEGKFSFEKDRYPTDERFANLQKPVAVASRLASSISNIWPQVPFCGSLIILIPAYSQETFERIMFPASEIFKVIDFIKETGRLQVAFSTHDMRAYQGLDYLDPFFRELKPPLLWMPSISIFENEKDVRKAAETFRTIGRIRYINWYKEKCQGHAPRLFPHLIRRDLETYVFLRLGRYAVTQDIENLMVDDPIKACLLIEICSMFIREPTLSLRSDLRNFALEDIKYSRVLPLVYRPQETRFPCEIGKFLMKGKLTYGPSGLDACKEIIYHYDAYDLRKVQESLNEAIIKGHRDIANNSAEELSGILDDVWNDKTIPRKVKGLQVGLPLSMAAIGSVAAGPIGAAGGFLAGLGYSVVDKIIDFQTEGLSEKLAKLRTRSCQANIYDFKEKYKHTIPKPSKVSQSARS